MSRKHKNVYTTLNYLEHFFILDSAITECILISAFASLIGISIGFKCSTIRLKICVIAEGIKKYETIINKEKKKHDKTVLLAKSKLNSKEVLISKALIDSNVSHDGFVLINNALKEYNNMKEEMKTLKN